jgi:hypothetical protein
MPSTASVRVGRSIVGLLRRPNPARRSLAHAAHTFSTDCGEVPSRALQATRVRSPAIPGIRGTGTFVTDGVDPFGSFVPGTDDPSAPFGSTVVARLRELIALLVPTPDAAPLRLLRPRARGPAFPGGRPGEFACPDLPSLWIVTIAHQSLRSASPLRSYRNKVAQEY